MEHPTTPHVVAIPFPAEGHIKPMLNLSKLLSHHGGGGLKVTFVNTHHNHARFHQFTDPSSFHALFPNLHFSSITDGVPQDHPRLGLVDFAAHMILPTTRSTVASDFRELFARLFHQKNAPRCIVADGMMSTIATCVAEEFGVPLIVFRTYSATCTWVTIHLSKLIHEGAVQHQDDMSELIANISGLETLLRDRDLPSVFRLKPGHPGLDFYIKETLAMTRASALILNTFDQLEAPIISNLATIFPKVFTIGPLHTLLKTKAITINGGGLREEDRSCITWLDHQKPKSVLYVSFGTVVRLSREDMLEFWHGLVNSMKPFLWVIRQDVINGPEGGLGLNGPMELELGTKERGLVVDWAPQEEVLAHYAVGGFLTHSGWNSTLESISEGVPMLCWPSITDQMVNSRCVSEQWRIGLDMNGTCDRFVVEKMVKDLMENQVEELTRSIGEVAKEANDSVKEDGSSYHNLESLIKHIRSLKVSN